MSKKVLWSIVGGIAAVVIITLVLAVPNFFLRVKQGWGVFVRVLAWIGPKMALGIYVVAPFFPLPFATFRIVRGLDDLFWPKRNMKTWKSSVLGLAFCSLYGVAWSFLIKALILIPWVREVYTSVFHSPNFEDHPLWIIFVVGAVCWGIYHIWYNTTFADIWSKDAGYYAP